jgi:hypothetical protein
MDKGTRRNVLTELHITSNQYNLVTVAYYVQSSSYRYIGLIRFTNGFEDPIYHCRSSFESVSEIRETICMAGSRYGKVISSANKARLNISSDVLGSSLDLPRSGQECWRTLYCPCSPGSIRKHVILLIQEVQQLNTKGQEPGLWPGILLQLCYWYRPDELPKRIVLVTVFGNFSAVISGILAFAFNGVHARGLSGWKW